MNQYKQIFSIDVEAEGLYGEPFAVGVSVISMEDGKEIDNLLEVAPLNKEFNAGLSGYNETYDFLSKNVLPSLPFPTCRSQEEMRDKFWNFYSKYTHNETLFVADCGAPVEAYFFRMCVLDNLNGYDPRKFKAPYPLHELGTLLLAKGKNPIGTYERLPCELPAHNPLNDARQSGRIFYENFKN